MDGGHCQRHGEFLKNEDFQSPGKLSNLSELRRVGRDKWKSGGGGGSNSPLQKLLPGADIYNPEGVL